RLEIGLDKRAPYGAAERKEQFDAVMRAHAVFGEMADLTDRIDAVRAAAVARAKPLPATDALAKKLGAFVDKLDAAKKKIVATKEGGMITGEERIREHLDTVYGALMSWEGKPARYQVERVDVLRRELADVAREFEQLGTAELRPLDEELTRRKLDPIAFPGA